MRAPIGPSPSALQTVPRESRICPSVTERSKVFPSEPRRVAEPGRPRPEPDAGRLGLVRIQLRGVPLLPAPGEDRARARARPRPPSPRALPTSRPGTRPRRAAGALRPPTPFWLRKLSMMPSRFAGIPIEVNASDRRSGSSRAVAGCRGSGRAARSSSPAGRPPGRCPPTFETASHQATASLLPGERRLVDEEDGMRPERGEVLQVGEDVRAVLRRRSASTESRFRRRTARSRRSAASRSRLSAPRSSGTASAPPPRWSPGRPVRPASRPSC